MPLSPGREVLVLADDLSGAVETSAALGGEAGVGPEVLLWPHLAPGMPSGSVCIDLDSRALRPGAARRRVAQVLWRVPVTTMLFKKVDSLLRGNLAPELRAVAATGRGMIVALAVPRENRSVRNGVVHLGETPLGQSSMLGGRRAANDRVAHALAGIPTRLVPIAQVRGGDLEALLGAALDGGDAAICDVTTEADLDLVAHAIARLSEHRPVAAVGASGLARALGRLIAPVGDDAVELDAAPRPSMALAVVGSRSERARQQIAALEASGVAHRVIARAEVRDAGALANRIRAALERGSALLSLSQAERWKLAETRQLAAVIAAVVDVNPGALDLVLIGGATARQVLDALDADRIRPLRELASGTVLCTTPRGHGVVIRPGSFGSESALVDLLTTLRGLHPEQKGRSAR